MKILIVDDSRFHQNFIKKIFNKYLAEAAILVANDGIEAFEVYQKERPDFVLTDLLMPKRSGQELFRLLKEWDKQAKVIVISADIQKSTRKEIEQMGALAFFNKPLNDETAGELLDLIKETAYA